jgi:hypothetical protein
LPYSFVDGIVDWYYYFHIDWVWVTVFRREGSVERGRGGVNPIGFGRDDCCFFGRVEGLVRRVEVGIMGGTGRRWN